MRDEQGKLNVLLGKRSIEPGKGKWSIPGGKWDDKKDIDTHGDPDYLKTALRETEEEIGLVISGNEDFLKIWKSHIPFFHYIVYSHQVSTPKTFAHNHEFSEVRWFPIDSLPASSVGFVRSQVVALVRQHHKG
jgi:8-oxo-dGTP pyrophosphatase MutT (NUDIX family)